MPKRLSKALYTFYKEVHTDFYLNERHTLMISNMDRQFSEPASRS
jgi:hypothetical protein